MQEGVLGGLQDAGDGDAVGGVGEGRFAFGDAFAEVLDFSAKRFGGVDGTDGFVTAADDHAEGFEGVGNGGFLVETAVVDDDFFFRARVVIDE